MISLSVVARILWTEADMDRDHRFRLHFDAEDNPKRRIHGGRVEVPLEAPSPSGHANHPNGIMPTLVVQEFFVGIEVAAMHRVTLFVDDVEALRIPFNVVKMPF